MGTEKTSDQLSRIRELVSWTKNADACRHWEGIEAEIKQVSPLSESERLAMARHVKNGTLFFMIRDMRGGNPTTFGLLLKELCKRTLRVSKGFTRGLDDISAEEIILQAELEILTLALSPTPSREGDYLVIAFTKGVGQRTIDALRKFKRGAMIRRSAASIDEMADNDAELDTPTRRASQSAAAPGPNPEQLFIQLDLEGRLPELIAKAAKALKDPRALGAVLLHHRDGWPIESRDPDKQDLVRYFNLKEYQVRYLCDIGLEALRAALGGEI